MADYSKWDQLARDEEEEEKREKERKREENKARYFKQQEEKQKKYKAEQEAKKKAGLDAGHGHSHSHGPHASSSHSHSHGGGDDDTAGANPAAHAHSHDSNQAPQQPKMQPLLTQPRRPQCGCGYADVEEMKRAAEEAAKEPKLSTEEKNQKKMIAVRATREHGKFLFQEGKYDQAFAVYERGVLIASGMFDLSPEDQAELTALEVILDVNMAACQLKQKNWSSAIDQCRLALQLDSGNVKAHFRWGCALLGLGEYEQAREKFSKALQLDTEGVSKREVAAQLQEIRRREQADREKAKLFAEQMKKKLAAQKSLGPEEEEKEQEMQPADDAASQQQQSSSTADPSVDPDIALLSSTLRSAQLQPKRDPNDWSLDGPEQQLQKDLREPHGTDRKSVV